MSGPAEEVNARIAELGAELEREQGKLRALQDVGQALGSTLDLDELVDILLARRADRALKDKQGKTAIDLAANQTVRDKLMAR